MQFAEINKADAYDGNEKRQNERLHVSTVLLFRNLYYAHSSKIAFFPGELQDLSVSGMRFATSSPVKKGDDLRVILRMFEILASDEENDLDTISSEAELITDIKVLGVHEVEKGSYEVRGVFEQVQQGNLELLEEFISKFSS